MNIENEHTLNKAFEQGLNMFLGSGFAIFATDSDGSPLPTGIELANELSSRFKVPNGDNLTLGQICAILESTKAEEYYTYLKKRFSVTEFDKRYLRIDSINIKNIFTTNIDNLLYKIFAESTNHYINDLDIKGPIINDKDAINTVTLHGCVLDDTRKWSFSSLDIASAFHADPDRWYSLTQRLQLFPTLFWGSSISDSGTLEALNPETIRGRPHKDKWIVITPETDEGTIQYFQALGFQLISASTSEVLDYICSQSQPAIPVSIDFKRWPTKKLFPLESIPEIKAVPVRPIIEFYMGRAPSWYDIFSGRIHQTEHYSKIMNFINSGKDAIVIGMPACGKTTLMMQLANNIPFEGHKLVCQSPSIEKARYIANRLGGQKALIFVDNFADNADSFQYFVQKPNILTVGFDRDYNYENVTDRIDCRKCNLAIVTELSERDMQQIISRIPKDVKSPYIVTKRITEGLPPSLFEIIELNITTPKLGERFTSVLEQLRQQNENLLDLLLVCSYVHSCRTPVSLDLLLAFFRDEANDYKYIFEMCERLKPIIHIYEGELADEEQDYWIPRSTIVSEAVISQAIPEDLRRVLLRFIKYVSPLRIPRYEIFRRKAYDSKILGKAFQNWREGMEFYDTAFNRENNYYLRQQGALYLAHKRRNKEAFLWIDEAITLSKGRNLSIQNSHAIILFGANIGLPPDDPTVEKTLHKSMDILSQCYHQDRRKTYHALRFADQAIQFWNIYHSKEANEYLITANKWLEEEKINAPWNPSIKTLLRDTKAILKNNA